MSKSTLRISAVACRTCVTRGGGVCPGDRADDVEVLEQRDPVGPSEVGLRPNQPVGSADGDPGLAGLQHHHHGVDVGDGDARVLAETPENKHIKSKNVWVFFASD